MHRLSRKVKLMLFGDARAFVGDIVRELAGGEHS
jgi:hypothetical protein